MSDLVPLSQIRTHGVVRGIFVRQQEGEYAKVTFRAGEEPWSAVDRVEGVLKKPVRICRPPCGMDCPCPCHADPSFREPIERESPLRRAAVTLLELGALTTFLAVSYLVMWMLGQAPGWAPACWGGVGFGLVIIAAGLVAIVMAAYGEVRDEYEADATTGIRVRL